MSLKDVPIGSMVASLFGVIMFHQFGAVGAAAAVAIVFAVGLYVGHRRT